MDHVGNRSLVPVVIGFVWAIDGEVKVASLLRSECCELNAKLSDVSTSDFFVEALGQHVHTKRELLWCCPEGDLS